VDDYCLKPNEQLFRYIKTRTGYIR